MAVPGLDLLALPPRALAQALEDLHTLAEGLRELTERGGDIDDLVESVRVLPRVEDELSANIALLRDDINPLRAELAEVRETIGGLHAEIRELRDKVPGI
jgi:predicted nuclease with TOPRIM domain